MMTPHEQYQCIAESLALLGGAARQEWKAAAAQAGLSPYYFQRVFRRHIGISPRQYAACLTLSDIKQRLAAGSNILDAAFDAGLSGGGRAHDLFLSMDGTTPGQFMGGAVEIDYGCAMSPFGRVFVAATARGVSLLQFVDSAGGDGDDAPLATVRKQWPHATLRADNAAAARWVARAFGNGGGSGGVGGDATPLHVRGTNFQVKVWQALLAIPPGAVASYGGLAQALLGSPRAARAVARAAAANPVAVLIPCHRLLANNGALTGYAWGVERKRRLLAAEFARHTLAEAPCES